MSPTLLSTLELMRPNVDVVNEDNPLTTIDFSSLNIKVSKKKKKVNYLKTNYLNYKHFVLIVKMRNVF